MAIEPQARYQSPQELAGEVERWLADEPVTSYREPARVRLRRWVRRHQTLVEISQKLAAADPSDAQAQRGLFVSYNKLGDVQLKSGRVTEALRSDQKGLEISQKLTAADPSDARAQRDLSVSYDSLGDVQLESGHMTEALGSSEGPGGVGTARNGQTTAAVAEGMDRNREDGDRTGQAGHVGDR